MNDMAKLLEAVHFSAAAVRRLVEEVSDDKSLPKQRRERLQVERAVSLSRGAKLVRLGDKIYNGREPHQIGPG